MAVDLEDLVRPYVRLAGRGLDLYLAQLRHVESILLNLLAAADDRDPDDDAVVPPRSNDEPAHPAAAAQAMLERSLQQSAREARVELFAHILDALVPDEVRILAALSDGGRAALLRVEPRFTRHESRTPLASASLIGRYAGIAVPRATSWYLMHLLELGLVEEGPEIPDLREDYDVLAAEPEVQAALSTAKGPLGLRPVKASVSLSRLGKELWEECGVAGTAFDSKAGDDLRLDLTHEDP